MVVEYAQLLNIHSLKSNACYGTMSTYLAQISGRLSYFVPFPLLLAFTLSLPNKHQLPLHSHVYERRPLLRRHTRGAQLAHSKVEGIRD
jgi:hypothetical protein